MTVKTKELEHVEALDLPGKAAFLPSVAVKIALGAELGRNHDQASVTFERETVVLHFEDFDLAARAAKRLAATMDRKVTPATLLSAMEAARGLVLDEIFAPGVARVLFFPSASQGSAFYRCGVPALAMNTGTRCRASVSIRRSAAEAADFDVVVFQLDHTESTISFASTLKDLGKKIVFEIDDAFDALEPWHPQFEVYRREEERDKVCRMMELADLVTVTTGPLAARFADRGNVKVLPNYIPLREWKRAEPHGTGEFRIVWAGSESHAGDLRLVAAPLAEFLGRHPEAKLFLMGMDMELIGVPRPQIEVLPYVPYGDYPAALAAVKADVAIAPLVDCKFNLAKSNVKLLEYGACGYPVAASDVGPYQKFHGVPTFSTPSELADLLEHMRNAEYRADLSTAIREAVLGYDMERNVKNIEDVYLGVLGRA